MYGNISMRAPHSGNMQKGRAMLEVGNEIMAFRFYDLRTFSFIAGENSLYFQTQEMARVRKFVVSRRGREFALLTLEEEREVSSFWQRAMMERQYGISGHFCEYLYEEVVASSRLYARVQEDGSVAECVGLAGEAEEWLGLEEGLEEGLEFGSDEVSVKIEGVDKVRVLFDKRAEVEASSALDYGVLRGEKLKSALFLLKKDGMSAKEFCNRMKRGGFRESEVDLSHYLEKLLEAQGYEPKIYVDK